MVEPKILPIVWRAPVMRGRGLREQMGSQQHGGARDEPSRKFVTAVL